jgi:hypothetical protein
MVEQAMGREEAVAVSFDEEIALWHGDGVRCGNRDSYLLFAGDKAANLRSYCREAGQVCWPNPRSSDQLPCVGTVGVCSSLLLDGIWRLSSMLFTPLLIVVAQVVYHAAMLAHSDEQERIVRGHSGRRFRRGVKTVREPAGSDRKHLGHAL